jgi:hypothetical protein
MDIEGLTVEVKMFANGSEIQTDTMFIGPGIIWESAQIESFDGLLRAGEVRELRGIVLTSLDILDRANALGARTNVAKVMLGDVVLDELTVP